MDQGWIKIHRKIQDNPLWLCETFSRGQAWIDLLILANHKDGFFYKRGVKIEVKRGQVGMSEVGLSKRWHWSRNKVRKFLNDLKKEQQIEQQKNNVSQIITILKYEDYQEKGQQKDSRRTAEGHQMDTNKNVKNNKNDKNNPLNPPKGENNVKSWRNDFEVYKSELRKVYKELLSDSEYIKEQEKFHPNVDIKLSIEKACKNFWATEAGWKHKKGKKSKEINWKTTLTNAIDMNKVYKQKDSDSKSKNEPKINAI